LDGTTVWITDTSEAALALASANVTGIGRAARNVRVAAGSWFDALPAGERFDVIVSNPPYVAPSDPHLLEGDVRFEPIGALVPRGDALSALRTIATGASRHLAPGGALAVEHGYDQSEAVQALLRDAGFSEIAVRRDLAGIKRVVGGRR
jgi:release factor glutamine methyltransferase